MNSTMRSEGSPTVADSQRFGRSACADELLYRGGPGRSVGALLALVAPVRQHDVGTWRG